MSLKTKQWGRETLVSISNTGGWLVLAIFFIALIIRIAGQAVPPGDAEPWPFLAFADYRDVIELPTQDLLSGYNPYDLPDFMTRNFGSQPFNVYLPQHFLFFGWLAFLPRTLAIIVLGLLSTISAGWLVREGLVRARLSLLLLPWILSFLIIRGPLFMALRTGQVAIILSAAAWLALRPEATRLRPLAICLCLIKPQVGIPVVVIALFLGRLRTVGLGLLLTVGASLPALVIILWTTTPVAFINSVLVNLTYSSGDQTFLSGALDIPSNMRALGIIGTGADAWITTLLILLLSCVVILGLRRSPEPNKSRQWVITWLAVLASIVVFPNQRYASAVVLPMLIPTLWPFRSDVPRLGRSPAGAVFWLAGVLLFLGIVRSESVELRLGFPPFMSASLTGWLFDGSFLLFFAIAIVVLVRSSKSQGLEQQAPSSPPLLD